MTTTDLLTFFQPDESSGIASTFSIQANNGPATEVWVFAREKVNLSRFASATISSDEERRSLLQEISRGLQPGGGILIYARPHNDVVKVQIYCFEGPKYASPKRILRLSLCGDSRLEDVTGKIDLEIGDHLIVPVSRDAQTRLSALYENLKGLPSDLESSVLNVIRRPSLEWRLDRIERALSMPPATQADQKRSRVRQGGFLERLHGYVMWKVPIGPALAIALLLTASALFAYDRYSKHPHDEGTKKEETQTDPQTTAEEPSTATVRPASDPSQGEEARAGRKTETALADLFASMKKSRAQTVQTLYNSHFKSSAQFWQSGKPTSSFWGMVKLQALRLNIATARDLLSSPDSQAQATYAYEKENGIKALNENPTALDLLGWLTCQGSDQPVFPTTDKTPNPRPLPTDRSCDELKRPESAVPGLEALTDWVNQQRQQAEKPAEIRTKKKAEKRAST